MIAIQCAVGDIGSKGTTELTPAFTSMVNAGTYQYGANDDGLYRLNTGTTDNAVAFASTFTCATTDFGENNPKRVRFVYVGIDTDNIFTVSVKVDDQAWRNYATTPPTTGLQRIRVPVGRDGEGRYWTVKFSSDYFFRIDEIKLLLYGQSTGKTGY